MVHNSPLGLRGIYITLGYTFFSSIENFSAYCPVLRGSILLPPRHLSVFARMARWQLPGVLGLLLRKTGHRPLHDIKSFDIGAFLSSLLLKEQMMISDKKIKKTLCYTIPTPDDIAKHVGVLRTKIASFKKATFISSQCFCCCCYCTG